MQDRTADAVVYGTLAVAASCYAFFLDRNKYGPARRKLEPNWTWVEVIVETSFCLGAAAIRARLTPFDASEATWRGYERIVRTSFAVGKTPIVLWQLGRTYDRLSKRADTLHQKFEEHYAKREQSSGSLATVRQPGQGTNGTIG